jgi:hypothetical protein
MKPGGSWFCLELSGEVLLLYHCMLLLSPNVAARTLIHVTEH